MTDAQDDRSRARQALSNGQALSNDAVGPVELGFGMEPTVHGTEPRRDNPC